MTAIKRFANSDKVRMRTARLLWLLTLVVPILGVVWVVQAFISWDHNDDLYGTGVGLGIMVFIVVSLSAAAVLGGLATLLQSHRTGRVALIVILLLAIAFWLEICGLS
jgi:hypothetical protein